MRKHVVSALLVAFGAALVRAGLTGDADAWVARAAWLVAATGVAVIVLGLLPYFLPAPAASCSCGDAHHADENAAAVKTSRWAPWALGLIVLVVAGVTPPAMTPVQVADATAAAAASGGADTWPELPPGRPEMRLREVVARSTAPADSRMSGREVVVEGQLATGDTGRREIARIAVNCCAADARKYRVELSDAMGRLDGHEDGSWIRATVLLMPGTGTEARGFVPSVGVIDVGEVDDPGYEIWDV